MDSALKAMPEDNELPPSATELIAGMRICASFMSSIMNNLLDVRKMEEGALSLKRVPVNLERILASLHRMFLPNVKPGVDFQWRSEFTSKDQGWVIGDSHRLQQIFTNVITNALKYTSHGSVILSVGWERDFVSSASASDQQGSSSATEDTVDASARDTLRGPFASTVNASGHVQDYKSYNEDDNAVSSDHDSSLEEQRDRPPPTILRKRESKVMEARKHILPTGPPRIRFECADTGPGILKSHQDQLFKKFVQRGGAPGTGLGLAISKHLVELMGGEIYYKSDPTVKPGSSCIVLLPLPLCDAPPGESDDDEDEAAVKSSKKRAGAADSKKDVPMIQEPISVLIVDDIRMNRMMLKRRLQKAIAPNALITESPNGETALEICEREIFDVIIMDQFMEDAGGLLLGTDTILALRREGVKAMIIGCSGNDIDKEFVEAGADQCWQKPLPTNETIIRQLRRHLDKNR